MPQNIYDNPEFFEGYSQFARSREGLSGAPEWTSLQAMLPNLLGASVLDLGCGFGYFAQWAVAQGATKVIGIDLSEKMLARARLLTDDKRITYLQGDLAQLEFPNETFDLVYSSLAFHYLPECGIVFKAICERLVPGNHFVFSVEHPLYTAPSHPIWKENADGSVEWPLNNYLMQGQRVTNWIAPDVVKYHRTIETYLNSLLDNGFILKKLIEWGPNEEHLKEHPEWANELHRPMFLLIGAVAA